jgi:hypothetical protein
MWLWAVHTKYSREVETMEKMWSVSIDKKAWNKFPIDVFFYGYIGVTANGFKSMRTHINQKRVANSGGE